MLTAGKDYGVRVIVAFEQRRVGNVFYPPGLLRDRLVKNGLVERVKPPTDLLDEIGEQDTDDTRARGRRKQGHALTR